MLKIATQQTNVHLDVSKKHTMETINIAMVDDHLVFRTAIAKLMSDQPDWCIISEADNGRELINGMQSGKIPDLIILDLCMPVMDGYETAEWLAKHHPQIPIIILSMYDGEINLMRLLQLGVKGYLKKSIDLAELRAAITSVRRNQYYYSPSATGTLPKLFHASNGRSPKIQDLVMNEKEVDFLKLVCSDLTYKEIAARLGMTLRGADSLRDRLFMKLNVKSRVGLAMMALRNGLVHLFT